MASSLDGIPLTLEGLEEFLRGSPAAVVAKLAEYAAPQLRAPWRPQPGPQTEAFYSPADEMLYGGAVGGGKTDLLVGLATTAHRRSLIFRAQSKDLDGFWSRLQEVIPEPASQNDVKRVLRTRDGRLIEGGHLGLPGSERDWQGRPHDLIGFDEAAQLDEMRVSFVMQWLRSTDPKQRKRVVFATNPPIPEIRDGQLVDTGLGDWLKRWFAPWIDDTFPNPALPGELRWCYMVAEGERLSTVWVDGPGAYDLSTGRRLTSYTEDDVMSGRLAVAKSRTFIRSLLSDNVYLRGTGYAERLTTTPEPLRTMLLKGDFTVRGEDHPMQVIPTQWVLDAQERWRNTPEDEALQLQQLVLYGDIAQGGADTTVLAPLMTRDYFDELVTKPGKDTPNGRAVALLVLNERFDQSLVALDCTGGWGAAAAEQLEDRYGIDVERHVVSEVDGSGTPDGLFKYGNMRAKMWWQFRLALDPASTFRIALPPSARLLTQLTTPHFYIRKDVLFVESKEDLRKRIGSSTDEADAVLGAWEYREQAILARLTRKPDFIRKLNTPPGAPGDDDDTYDPLGDW